MCPQDLVKYYMKRPLHLANIVKGEPGQEDVRKGLQDAEESINDPVGQPLCVVLFDIALNGLDTK